MLKIQAMVPPPGRAQQTLFAVGAAVALLAAAPYARAQDEGPWKRFVVEGMNAAGEKDYAAAEKAFVKALSEAETFGPQNIRVGSTLNSLGLVYRAEKKYSEAEAAYRRALRHHGSGLWRKPRRRNVNFNLAGVLFDLGHQVEALPNLRTTLAIYERLLGENSLKTAATLCMEGEVLPSNEALSGIREGASGVRRYPRNRMADWWRTPISRMRFTPCH